MALFDVLPPDLFKPLASPTRKFYAELLLHLHERTFTIAAEAPRRSEVIAEIQSFTARWDHVYSGPSEGEPATSPEDRARATYQRLIETGWFIEHKEGYIRLVDIDPDASGLLHLLASIERGETRSYGGAVVAVLSALENAAANPTERSENIRNALRGARDFLAHMRMVSVSLRKVEERIVRQETLREVFRHFFEDFVQRHLIADFKTLHTKDNPFRFRAAIIRQAQTMQMNALVMRALGEAYWREGRAASLRDGEKEVSSDLSHIASIFEGTEAHLKAIDATAARIERRIMNTARYMDRSGRGATSKIVEAISAVSKTATEDDIPTRFVAASVPLGPAHIPLPRKEKAPISQTQIRPVEKDPALERFMGAKADYVRKTRVTPRGLMEFIERHMPTSGELRGCNIRIETVEDFVSFQRMREIPSIFDGAISRRYQIEFLPARISNEWLECQDFVVTRRAAAKQDMSNAA